MSRLTRQKRSREESFTISSPSTFRSSEFHIKENSSKITKPSMNTLSNISEKKDKLNSAEKDLWNQVLNIRQLVSRMQKNLIQLNSDVVHENDDANSNFDLSKEIDSHSLSSAEEEEDEDSWNDEDSIINLEGILVHVSSSDTSSSSEHQDDDAFSASSCVSSLGLGGHETTAPFRSSTHDKSKSIARGNLVSPVYSESAAAAATITPSPAAPVGAIRRNFQFRQDTMDEASVDSSTAMQEFLQLTKILYFFLLEFPIHLYSFLSDCIPAQSKPPSVARRRDQSKREKQRWYLYSILVLFIMGCVVWKQCPTCFDYSMLSKPSQSCVTPTVPMITQMNTTTTTSPSDFAPPLLSVHSTMRSKMPRLSQAISPSTQETIQLFDDDEMDGTANTATEEIIVTSVDPQEEKAPKNPLLRQIQKVAKNNHKMWQTAPSESPTAPPPPQADTSRRKQGQLVKNLIEKVAKNNHKMWQSYSSLSPATLPTADSSRKQGFFQEKGQDLVRKLVQNNHKMWDQYPTLLMPQDDKGTSRTERGGRGFLQKTANMWSDKSSDYFLVK